jgi:hypothetical protein
MLLMLTLPCPIQKNIGFVKKKAGRQTDMHDALGETASKPITARNPTKPWTMQRDPRVTLALNSDGRYHNLTHQIVLIYYICFQIVIVI